jgi:hypothetical protein
MCMFFTHLKKPNLQPRIFLCLLFMKIRGFLHCQSHFIVVLKLVVSFRWSCDLDKLSTILEMKTLHRQLAIHNHIS